MYIDKMIAYKMGEQNNNTELTQEDLNKIIENIINE